MFMHLLSGSPKGCFIGGSPGKACQAKAGAGAQEEEEERISDEETG